MTSKIKTKAQALRICELRQKGMTAREIGAMMGIAERTVFWWVAELKKRGIKCETSVSRGGQTVLGRTVDNSK